MHELADKNVIPRHFIAIMKDSLKKAFKLINIKIEKGFFRKIQPKVFISLINKEIKIDLREFKKFDFGKKDKDCPDFIFKF